MRKLPHLDRIEQPAAFAQQDHDAFEFHLQKSLLLALSEQGRLDRAQYRHALDRLQAQRRARVKQTPPPAQCL